MSKIRALTFAAMAAVLMATASIAMACGNGDEELTIEGYFGELEALEVRMIDQLSELNPQFEALSLAETDDEVIELSRDLLPRVAPVVSNFVGGLRDVDPPAEVRDEHNAAVSAGEASVEALDGIADRARDIESADEAFALQEELFTGEAFQALGQACLDLRATADDHGVALSLQC